MSSINFTGAARALSLSIVLSAAGHPMAALAAQDKLAKLRDFATADGKVPLDGLVEGVDGAFYGVTTQGGSHASGVVYRIDAKGNYSVVHHYLSGEAPAGGGLSAGADGSLYGAMGGGEFNLGALYAVRPGAAFEVLYSFTPGDTITPWNTPILASDGALIGMAAGGGTECGALYRYKNGKVSVIHALNNDRSEGCLPMSRMVQATNGRVYGRTMEGGADESGTIFSATTSGSFKVVLSMPFNYNGGYGSPLIEGGDGNLYGANYGGGEHDAGAIFRMTPGGKYKIIHSFDAGLEGQGPTSLTWNGVEFAGALTGFGPDGLGSVYRMTPTGKVKLAFGFGHLDPVAWPDGLVALRPDGSIFGTGRDPSGLENGTIFRLTPRNK